MPKLLPLCAFVRVWMMVASVKRFVFVCVPFYSEDYCCSGDDVRSFCQTARGVPFGVRE